MITPRPYQRDAVELLRKSMSHGGEMTIKAPTGYGVSIIIAEASRCSGRVAYVHVNRALGDQLIAVCEKMNVTNVECVKLDADLSAYDVVFVSDEPSLRGKKINHNCVIRQS